MVLIVTDLSCRCANVVNGCGGKYTVYVETSSVAGFSGFQCK
jgi:hypothetical protein